jgi:hypothetical protein
MGGAGYTPKNVYTPEEATAGQPHACARDIQKLRFPTCAFALAPTDDWP